MFKFKLGGCFEDEVTGFRGVAMGQVRYLTSPTRYLLVPQCEDRSKANDGEWFEECRLRGD